MTRTDREPSKPLGLIGLIGLGNVGLHYAEHLLSASRALTVYDQDPEKTAAIAELGAPAARSARELAQASEAVVLALPDPQAVEAALLGADGVLAARGGRVLVIDASTIDPETSLLMHDRAKSAGHHYVDAPMSGGEPGGAGQAGAKAGTVTFMVGGDPSAVQSALPVLQVLGRRVIHVGPAGTGTLIKLISNLIAGLNMAVMAEGFMLASAAGVSHETLLHVFRYTDAKSYTMFEEFAPHLRANDYTGGFPVELMHKDHRLAADLGQKYRVPLPFNQLALEVYQACRSRGHGRKSHAVVVETLAELAGVQLFNKGERPPCSATRSSAS